MTYRFGDCLFDPKQFELRRGGQSAALEPQVVSLLAYLIENRERVVTKDEINTHVWGGRAVSDAALSSRIKILRQALGDDGKAQRMIRTVHGVGFRFIAVLEDERSGDTPISSSSVSHTKKPTVAVLPFTNLSSDLNQDYFSDGITTDIITTLSRHRWLTIIARNTSFGYRGVTKGVQKIGTELGADYIVEGSVQRAGVRIRINAQLIDASSGSQIWAERYDRDFEDIFAVQDDITQTVAARLEPEIGTAERQKALRADRRNLQAWDCYHLGVAHFFRFTAEDNKTAQELLARARTLDPGFGEAHAWWAYAVILGMIYWETEPSPTVMEDAYHATCTALEIDDRNAVFYALKARVQLARCEYQSAIVENEMAIKLNPTFAAAYCGLADSMAFEGRYDQAISGFEKALDMSPNDPQRWAFLTYGALALIFDRQFEKALEWATLAAEIPNRQYWTTAHRIVALAYLERQDEVNTLMPVLRRECPGFSLGFVRKKMFYVKRKEQLQLYLEGMKKAGISA